MKNNDEIVDWCQQDMLEIILEDPDDFLKVKETLTRIGVASKRDQHTLYQSCHILHKQGRYYIVHFKEMFLLDGKPSTFTVEDLKRRNTIALLLADWGLLRIADASGVEENAGMRNIKVVSYRDKIHWLLVPKYTIGKV